MNIIALEKYPLIKPGKYKGIWGGYTLNIIFDNGKKRGNIKLNMGIRCTGKQVEIEVLNDGLIKVIE